MSLAILIVLILGILGGIYMPLEVTSFLDQASSYMLLLLLFSVGIDLGLNRQVFLQIRQMGFRILLIPFGVILGSLCGGGICAVLLQMQIKEGLAIASGLGWYSLSGILITEAGNPIGGTISFLSNVFREVITFISIPFLVKYLNSYSAIAPAGATAMDTTLGIISKNTDGKTAIIAFVSGVICTLLVPVLVPLFL
ncbi:lysine exporter LysO family protein [Anaerotignum sp. MB30-C6]|uniref:lysine exporter LysO family protein n=1 Tax=Anaerotignum sp. MB30-C6 TaxID=3070814 RepID=UPI0027DBB718|nr:lysine exporter LysO family protein [Anaerotignum sp. MB30-C6]WMI80868.1 lysine exporter LysO family protein [Anaerotignum sp. MB30-C6]